MTERTQLELELIEACRGVLLSQKPDFGDTATQGAIWFAGTVLDLWQTQGPLAACQVARTALQRSEVNREAAL